MKPLAEEDLQPLITMVRQDRGIDLSRYKDRYLRRRIGVRLRASGAHNLKHYLRLLSRDEGEYGKFIDTVTVNTSNFFRNSRCFQMLADHVLPELNARGDLTSLRPPHFLSAGCARGEEAYSLAILVSRFPQFTRELVRPPVIAIDIDISSLDAARAGRYGSRALAGVPAELKNGYFEKSGSLFSVSDRIKNLISFMRHDILNDPLPGRFLLVLCRNLLIYLEKEAQEMLIQRLTDSLYPGGYLVLGKSEVLVGETRSRFKPVFPGERIYQKVDHDHGPPEPPPAPGRVE